MTDRLEVPLLDLVAQRGSIRAELDAALAGVVDSQHFVLGPEVAALEEEIARYVGARCAVGCASGTDALLLAVMAADVGPGDEVIVPAYSFFATAGSVARVGARPVFADIDPDTFNIDPVSARKAAEHCTRLRAIIPVHLFGQMADLDALGALAEQHGVPLIEDAAQALGALDARGQRAGAVGAIGCFSFYPTKNLGAFGDAGMITTSDEAHAERIASLRVHGESSRYIHREVGLNSHLDAIQAAVLRVKLRHLDAWNDARRANAACYDQALADAPGLRTPRPAPDPARHVYHHYVVRVPAERRDTMRDALAERGVATGVYYPLGLHQQDCFTDAHRPDLPETEAAARESLALPVYAELREQQRAHVITAVLDALRG